MAKKDTAERRLARSIKSPQFIPTPISIPREHRPGVADQVLTLGYTPREAPIRRAFEAFKLDPQNPFHWRILLWHLADAQFGERKRRRLRWSPLQFLELQKRMQAYPGETDTAIAKRLQQDYRADYGLMTESNLRKLMRQARKI